MRVCTLCRSAADVMGAIADHAPDVLVVDLEMQRGEAWRILRAVAAVSSPPQILILTRTITDEQLMEIVRLGARGVVLEAAAVESLGRCVRTVADGEFCFPQDEGNRALQRVVGRGSLTQRETEVVRHIALGLSNKEVARCLDISEGTVKLHVHRAYAKLGLKSRVALAQHAREIGLV